MTTSPAPGAACPNCFTPVTGPYCAQCGQKQGAIRVSLRRILADVLEHQLNVDATLPRTLQALLVQPGRLTREYLNQRIARYVPPVRLYLISSVLFFLLLSFFTGPSRFSLNLSDATGSQSTPTQAATSSTPVLPESDSGIVRAATPDADPIPSDAARDGPRVDVSDRKAGPIEVNPGDAQLNHFLEQRMEALRSMSQEQLMRELARNFFEHAPKVMFVMLPVFALLLKLFYFRRYYVEHFIFALHLHAFTFAIFTLVLILPDWIPYVSGLLLAWIPIYTFIAMKQVYGQGLFGTVIKWWTLGVAYTVLLSFGVAGVLLVALATM